MRSFGVLVPSIAVCLAMAVAAPAASAANEIAYRCDLDICLLDPANPSVVTNLTDNGETSYDEQPTWSPDGKKIAFVSDYTKSGHGQKNVFVMEPGAAEQGFNLATQVTSYESGALSIHDLAWAPDGSRIAYTRGNNTGEDQVDVVNADGTTLDPLTIGSPGDNKHPTWSADSSKIAYSAGNQVYVASSTGGLGTALTDGDGREPAWSPDGATIAFDWPTGLSDYVDLKVVDADGSGAPVSVVDQFPYSEWTFAAWSPDSGRVAYRGHGEGEDFDIRVVNANGSNDHALPGSTSENVYAPSWSPDGSRVVYEGFRFLQPSPNHDIYVANADGSGTEVPLTTNGESYEPSWRVVRSTPQAPSPTPGTAKPKIVWITKRIFVTKGPDLTVIIGAYGCSGGSGCAVETTGKMKGAAAAGLNFRPSASAVSSATRRGGTKKPKWIVVGSSKMEVPAGATRKLKLRLNKTGVAVLGKRGKATIQVTVTTTEAGQKYRLTHTVHVYLKKPAKKKHGH